MDPSKRIQPDRRAKRKSDSGVSRSEEVQDSEHFDEPETVSSSTGKRSRTSKKGKQRQDTVLNEEQEQVGQNEPIRGMISTTKVVKYDHSVIEIGLLEEGDELLGPDGTPRKVYDLRTGKQRLYKIQLGRIYKDAFSSTLYVTAETNMAIREKVKGNQELLGTVLAEPHRQHWANILGGPLPVPSSPVFGPGSPKNKTRKVDTLETALKAAVACCLGTEETIIIPSLAASLAGNKGISIQGKSYIFQYTENATVYKELFCWSDPDVYLHGPDMRGETTKSYFTSQKLARKAALAASAAHYSLEAVSITDLIQRFQDKAAILPRSARIRVDTRLEGVSLELKHGNPMVRLRFRNGRNAGKGECWSRCWRFDDFANFVPATTIMEAEIDTAPLNYVGPGPAPSDGPVLKADTDFYSRDRSLSAATLAEFDPDQLKSCRLWQHQGYDCTEQAVPVDPYFLGLWLGDGSRSSTTISNNHETPIRVFLLAHAQMLGMHLSYHGSLFYTTVARQVRQPVRPLPGPTTDPLNRPAGPRESRYKRYQKLLRKGWTYTLSGKPGDRKRLWMPPADLDLNEAIRAPATTSLNSLAVHESTTMLPVEAFEESFDETMEEVSESAITTPGEVTGTSSSYQSLREDGLDVTFSEVGESNELESNVGDTTTSIPDLPDSLFVEEDGSEFEADESGDSDPSSGSDIEIVTEMHEGTGIPRGRYTRVVRPVYLERALTDTELAIQDEIAGQVLTSQSNDEPASDRGDRSNKLLVALRKLNCVTPTSIKGPEGDRKHIPEIYMRNTRKVRLAVLGGLIDSDGWYNYVENCFVVAQAITWHHVLFADIVALARGLGYQVCVSLQHYNQPRSNMLYARISGDIEEIPCLLARKKATKRYYRIRNTWTIKSVTLREEEQDWVEFKTDGDHRYLRDDHMVLHAANHPELC